MNSTNFEQAELLVAFLEVIADPNKAKQFLNELKVATTEYKKYVEAYTDVSKANKYFKLKDEAFDTKVAEFESRKEKFALELKANETKFDEKIRHLDKREQLIILQEQTQDKLAQQIKSESEKLSQEYQNVNNERMRIRRMQEDLETRLQVLKEREDRIKSVLG